MYPRIVQTELVSQASSMLFTFVRQPLVLSFFSQLSPVGLLRAFCCLNSYQCEQGKLLQNNKMEPKEVIIYRMCSHYKYIKPAELTAIVIQLIYIGP